MDDLRWCIFESSVFLIPLFAQVWCYHCIPVSLSLPQSLTLINNPHPLSLFCFSTQVTIPELPPAAAVPVRPQHLPCGINISLPSEKNLEEEKVSAFQRGRKTSPVFGLLILRHYTVTTEAEFEPLGILHLRSMHKALSVLREKWINKDKKQDHKKVTGPTVNIFYIFSLFLLCKCKQLSKVTGLGLNAQTDVFSEIAQVKWTESKVWDK